MTATDPLDRAGLDTWLARDLHDSRRLPFEALADALAAARGAGGRTLARVLVERGLVERGEVARWIGARAGGPDASRPAEARVGPYRLLRKLGAGGMGTVFEAEDTRSGARVALKLLPLGGDPEALARFEREGQAQAAVDRHPHVARVHAAGVAGGAAYLALELLEGGDLATRLRASLPPPEQAAGWVRDLALGVAHVHRAGIVHRDIKAPNVLFDGEGRAKLVDFGIARMTGAARLTRTGALVGTPATMAPEQASGAREVGEQADVYGLGALLYHALCGRLPFEGAPLEVLNAVLREAPPRPRALRPEVPPALEAICLRALAKDPGERQPGAAALAAELEAFLAGQPPAPRARREPRRAALAASGLALAAALIASALASWRPSPASPEREPPAPRVRGAWQRARGGEPAPVTTLAAPAVPGGPRRDAALAPPPEPPPDPGALARDWFAATMLLHGGADGAQAALPLLDGIARADPTFRGLWFQRAQVLVALGRDAEAVVDFTRALEGDEADPAEQSECHYHRAKALWRLGRLDEARADVRRCRELGVGVFAQQIEALERDLELGR